MEVEQIKNMGLRFMSAIRGSDSSPPSGDSLVMELQDYSNECQAIYGNKKSLATDQDFRVSNLCNQWVKVISHGMKVPVSNYQPIQTLLTAGLNFAFNLNLLDIRLWNYTKFHLTKHEEDRFKLLKTINTPLGYFKAFLRSALNEKSLERYLLSWISHSLLKEFYEDWAIVRDPNLARKLPIIASELTTIFFALSIDQADLNNLELIDNQSNLEKEPVVESNASVVKCNNKRTIRQIISFDNENIEITKELTDEQKKNDPAKASSCRDTLAKVSSVSTESVTECDDAFNESHANRLMLICDKTNNLFVSDRSLDSNSHHDSDVSSGSGEIKRLSDNGNSDVERESQSDLLVKQYETNMFLKMKISQMEEENKEKSERMENMIHNLTKENNKLKEQLRNYVSAVETLKQDNTQSEEIKHYEAKLIQVAQMHAELMEFNAMLQKQLQRQIEPFGTHYPLSSFTGIPDCSVNVWIPSTYLITKGSKSFHVYQIFLKVGVEEWNVYRRYSEFRKLYVQLKNMHPDISTVKFPPKKTLGKKDAWLVEQRRSRLQAWLRHIIHALPQLQSSNSRQDLVAFLPFFSDTGNYENTGVLRPLPTP